MEVNYQIIIDLIANMGIIVFPIALIFLICGKLIDLLLSFIGNRRVKL